jgi:hypothetical protein
MKRMDPRLPEKVESFLWTMLVPAATWLVSRNLGFAFMTGVVFGAAIATSRAAPFVSLIRAIVPGDKVGGPQPFLPEEHVRAYWADYEGSARPEKETIGTIEGSNVELGIDRNPVARKRLIKAASLKAHWADYDKAHRERFEAQTNPATPQPGLTGGNKGEKTELNYGYVAPHLTLINETKSTRLTLLEAAKRETGDFGVGLANMISDVDEIITGLKAAPEKLAEVQRLFTYYLPEVSNLLDVRAKLIERGETKGVTEIETILDRTELAFDRFAARMHLSDIRELEIDLRMLDQALAAEFEADSGRG